MRVMALDGAAVGGRPHQQATEALVIYLADDVLTHAEAEEQTFYRAAMAHGELAGTVSEMISEHRALSAAVGRLAGALDATAAAEQARQIGALFATHGNRENEILLPALAADSQADLSTLLGEMHRRTVAARQAAQGAAGQPLTR